MEKQKNTISTNLQKAIYEIAIRAYKALIRLASFRSEKAKKWIEGRENWRELLASKIDPNKPRILVHAASLGEMEQGLPILKKLREAKPEHQIILSFYSPSGYEHFKESKLYDLLIYLPEDSSKNAADFASIVQAQLALFIKYEIWPNLLASLKAEDCKLVLAPAVFRPQQVYFKAPKYNWLTKSLHNFDHILVQDEASLALLSPLKLKQLSICGDSRLERAQENREQSYFSKIAQEFASQNDCIIIGSSWPKEENLGLKILQNTSYNLILAPHEIGPSNIERLEREFREFSPSLFTSNHLNKNSRLLIIDSIGDLKFLYRYAKLALIGGGFGKGVHSTLEAAVYQIPILFGPNHKKFPETIEMEKIGLAKMIENYKQLEAAMNNFLKPGSKQKFEDLSKLFLEQKLGASNKILHACLELLETHE